MEFLDNSVIHRPTSQATKFSETPDKTKLPHYNSLPSIMKKEDRPQNVLNLDDEHQKREDTEMEKQTKDMLPERGDKFMQWSSDNQDSMTLVKGYFQQWITTPDNYRSIIQVC